MGTSRYGGGGGEGTEALIFRSLKTAGGPWRMTGVKV